MKARPDTGKFARGAAGVLLHSLGAALSVFVVQAAEPSATAPADRASYEFAAGRSTAVAVRLEREGAALAFTWPAQADSPHDTVLLALRVEADAGSSAPSIEVATSSQRVRHYLDSGAQGLRWLNLSHLDPAPRPGDRVSLQGEALNLAPQDAELRLFDNHLDLGARILVIAPHPDDAEIAAFGLYADRHSTVVTVTAGNAGDANYAAEEPDQARQYELKGRLRAYDSVTVPWLGGVPPQRTANLGYFDARLDVMYQKPAQVVPELYGPNTDVARYRIYNLSSLVPGTSRSNSWRHLVEDLTAVLRQVRPEIIVMPDPRLDGHRDHEFTSVALVQALDRWGGAPRFLLYTNHADENLYPYGPRGAPVSLPPLHGPVSVERVFSLATPPGLQTRKLFALEAMHDLRPSPDEQVRGETDPARWRPDYPRRPEVDYFRRGPRANELFLAYDSPGVRAVVREFLASYRDQ
jgi:LmbE family N-acetylglucosaminyl deacetylase